MTSASLLRLGRAAECTRRLRWPPSRRLRSISASSSSPRLRTTPGGKCADRLRGPAQSSRQPLGDFAQRVVGENPAARLVVFDRGRLPPLREQLGGRALLRLQAIETLEPAPRRVGIGAMQVAAVRARASLRTASRAVPRLRARRAGRDTAARDSARRLPRTAVAPALSGRRVQSVRVCPLRKRVAEALRDERAVADLRRMIRAAPRRSACRRSDPGRRGAAHRERQDFEVLPCRVQHLDAAAIARGNPTAAAGRAAPADRSPRSASARRRLDQAQFRIVGALAHELGVERDEVAARIERSSACRSSGDVVTGARAAWACVTIRCRLSIRHVACA